MFGSASSQVEPRQDDEFHRIRRPVATNVLCLRHRRGTTGWPIGPRRRALVFTMASGSPLQDFQAAGVPAAGAQGVPALNAAPRQSAPASVGLLVLSRDEALVHTLRAIGSEYEVFAVNAESDFAAHLLSAEHGRRHSRRQRRRQPDRAARRAPAGAVPRSGPHRRGQRRRSERARHTDHQRHGLQIPAQARVRTACAAVCRCGLAPARRRAGELR